MKLGTNPQKLFLHPKSNFTICEKKLTMIGNRQRYNCFCLFNFSIFPADCPGAVLIHDVMYTRFYFLKPSYVSLYLQMQDSPENIHLPGLSYTEKCRWCPLGPSLGPLPLHLTHGMSFLTIVSHPGSLSVTIELSEARN